MKLVRQYCAPIGALFFPLFLYIASSLLSLQSRAHTVVLSEYSLEYKNEQWVLTFEQKTSQLRDAIYALRPDLQGINLNSEAFLDATEDYIISNMSLKYHGEELRIVRQHMHYSGLRFESRFIAEGLPDAPEYLNIQVNGFDAHEHSIVLFRVIEETEGYLNYFNQEQRLGSFDFKTKSFAFEEVKTNGRHISILYALISLIIIGFVVKLIRAKKVT